MRPLATASLIALLTASITLAASLVPRQAFAQADVDAQVEKLESDAAKAYSEGNYKAAIGLMAKANQLRPHPNYLLNIAVSYSKIGDCDNAKLWGQNAIDSTNPELPPEAKETARAVIASCVEHKDETVGGGGAGTEGDPNKENDDGTDRDPVTTETPTPWVLYTGYGLAAVGGVAIVGSIVGDLGVGSDIDELETLRNSGNNNAADQLQSDIEGKQTLVTVGYVVGFLAAASGGALIYLDTIDYFGAPAPADAAETSVRMLPIIDHQRVGLSLGLTF